MFIKLTRTDGRPIWINPEFVVTVEDRKGGGAIVVPAGDGLDYDVKESSEAVMRLCGGEPPAEAPAPEPPPPDPNEALPIVNAPDLPVDQAEATAQALRDDRRKSLHEFVRRIAELARHGIDRFLPPRAGHHEHRPDELFGARRGHREHVSNRRRPAQPAQPDFRIAVHDRHSPTARAS